MSNFISGLMSDCGAKSFYGKAKVLHLDLNHRGYYRILFSYNTPVILYKEKEDIYKRLCDISIVSKTTARHIKSFSGLSKSEFEELQFEKLPEKFTIV